MSNTPSDEDIVALARSEGIKVRTGAGVVKLARAILAKWGTPQPVVREMECTCSAKDAPFSTCCKVREAFEQWYDSQEYGRLQPFDVFKGGWVSRGITQKGGS